MLLRSEAKSGDFLLNVSNFNIEDIITRKQMQCALVINTRKQSKPVFDVSFTLAVNNSTHDNFKRLIKFKCVISRQLPKMPRQYITKLLFDEKHESILVQTKEGKIIGGICFRCFEGKEFVQIVFLAVESAFKDQKFGTRLMDNLKEVMQERRKNLLLTYADNTAVGFFRKQGFEPVIETPEKAWSGFIKVYLEGTLMECKIYDNLKYTKFRGIINDQKNILLKRIKQHISNQQKYAGNDLEKIKIRSKNSSPHLSIPYEVQLVPGVLQSRWNTEQEEMLQQNQEITVIMQQLYAIEWIRKQSNSLPLRKITSLPIQPQYQGQDLIDLPTIEKKIISGKCYLANEDLCMEIKEMFATYKKVLDPTSEEYKKVSDLEEKTLPILALLAQRKLIIHIDPLFKKEPITKTKKSKSVVKSRL